MAITKEEAKFLEGETAIKAEAVFLGKDQDQPVSNDAQVSGIPQGILLLTNKRLFFLNKKERGEEEVSMKRAVARGAAKGTLRGVIEGAIPFRLGELAVAISDLGRVRTKKIKEIDFAPFLDSEHSFVIPVGKIVSFEKFGSRLSLRPKSSFLRIIISDEEGLQTSYCMYGNVPGRPFTKIMNQGKWTDALGKVVFH